MDFKLQKTRVYTRNIDCQECLRFYLHQHRKFIKPSNRPMCINISVTVGWDLWVCWRTFSPMSCAELTLEKGSTCKVKLTSKSWRLSQITSSWHIMHVTKRIWILGQPTSIFTSRYRVEPALLPLKRWHPCIQIFFINNWKEYHLSSYIHMQNRRN